LKLEQQHGQVGQQGVIRPGSPEAWSMGEIESKKERERELESAFLNSDRTTNKTGEILQT
jgi:hypothetical protein